MKERVIGIIGANGFVGSELIGYFSKDKFRIDSPTQEKVNVVDFSRVDHYVANCTSETILHLAAYTNVDGAQKEVKLCEEINVLGTKNLGEAVKKHKKHVVFVSTDYVFDEKGLHTEGSKKASINSKKIGVYARSKIKAENELQRIGCDCAIVRISSPFGINSSERDFLHKLLTGVNQDWKMWTNTLVTPTYIPDLYRALRVIIDKRLTGIFHVATHPGVSQYEIAAFANKLPKGRKKVIGGEYVLPQDFSVKSPRPFDSRLDTTQTEKTLGFTFLSWQEAIDEAISS